jgi:hypothetical protein
MISIEAINLTKVYFRGSEEIPAVNDVSLQINKGDFISTFWAVLTTPLPGSLAWQADRSSIRESAFRNGT